MIGFEQHQSLAVDFLQGEIVGVVGAALQVAHKVHHFRHLFNDIVVSQFH